MPDGNADRLWIAMSVKAPADNCQVFVNRVHRPAEVLGNLPGASTCGETSEDVHPSICKH
jgi:hypothetical protein